MVTMNKPSAGATGWGGDINDNWTTIENELVEQTVVYKPSDETVNNSATFQDDDDLKFSIGANETWVASLYLFAVSTSGTPQMKVQITVPAGASVKYGVLDGGTAAAGTSSIILGLGTNLTVYGLAIWVKNGGTAGTAQLQWAQRTATAADTTVKKGSFLTAHEV